MDTHLRETWPTILGVQIEVEVHQVLHFHVFQVLDSRIFPLQVLLHSVGPWEYRLSSLGEWGSGCGMLLLLLLLKHQLAQRRTLLQLRVEGHPETVLWGSMPQLNVRLSHDVVLLKGE